MHDTTLDSAPPPVSFEPRPLAPVPQETRGRLPLVLFVLTALTTFVAGALGWQPGGFEEVVGDTTVHWYEAVATDITTHWPRGLLYMAAVLTVLSAHEAGHVIAARLHGIRTTLPFFIPMPVPLTGTLGAVIGMEGSRANRRQLFDIALAGPIAGLVVALPLLAIGMAAGGTAGLNWFALPPLARWIQEAVRPDLGAGTIAPNALFMAGWVGLLVTGLNMIPISQLDGGHICRAVFGKRGDWVARGVLLAAMAGIVVWGKYEWLVMVVAVTLLGADHPPIREDGRSLGAVRTVLGLLAFLIPVVTFMPEPLALP